MISRHCKNRFIAMSLLGYAMWLNKEKRHVFFLEFAESTSCLITYNL